MSKYKPENGDKFKYEGTWYELGSGSNYRWYGRDMERNEIRVAIEHRKWLEASKFFEDYRPIKTDNILDDELFII